MTMVSVQAHHGTTGPQGLLTTLLQGEAGTDGRLVMQT